MKRLMVLIMFFGWASLASALPAFDISINGQFDPPPEIWLCFSDIAFLDIHVAADVGPGLTGTYWVMYCQTSCGAISGGYVTEPWASDPDYDIFIVDDAVGNGGIPLPPGTNGVWGGVWTLFGPTIPACTVLYDGIIFHCESADPACRDVVITLQEVTLDWELGMIYDIVVIHQIPEPSTLLLLGFGAVMARKKRSKIFSCS